MSARMINAAELIAIAEKNTGLSQWGETAFRDGLDALVQSYNNESLQNGVTETGAKRELDDLTLRLEQRLRFFDDRKKYPAIANEIILQPIFVCGMPRTGTTHLHRLLSLDPDSRWPAAWEVILPSPPPEASTYVDDPRIHQAARIMADGGLSNENFAAIHEFGAQLPDECQHIFEYNFRSLTQSGRIQKPSFVEWIRHCDMLPAYQFHKMFLQMLQWRNPGKHWVLKSPQHWLHIPELLAVYPDAKIVFTHREPQAVIPSLISIMMTLQGLGQIRTDPQKEYEKWLTLLPEGFNKIENLRTQPDYKDTFIDVHFDALTADPTSVVEDIYKKAGMPLSQKMQQNLAQHMNDNPRHRKGVHQYSLTQYGLDGAAIEDAFSSYSQLYGRAPR